MREKYSNISKKTLAKRLGLSAVIAVGIATEYDLVDEAQVAKTAADISVGVSTALQTTNSIINNFPTDSLMEDIPIDIAEYGLDDPTGEIIALTRSYVIRLPELINDYNNRDDCRVTPDSDFNRASSILEGQEVLFESDQEEKHLKARTIAEKYGLTLADDAPYHDLIDNSNSFLEVLSYLNHYTSNHGLKFFIPDESDFQDYPIKYDAIDIQKFDLDNFKNSSRELISGLYYIPTEISNFAGINEIKIVDKIKFAKVLEPYAEQEEFRNQFLTNNDTSPGGLINPVNKKIYIGTNNLPSISFSRRVLHELSHGIAFNYCGTFDALSDKEFAEMNPPGFVYKDHESFNMFTDITSSKFGYDGVYEDQAYIMNDFIFTGSEKYDEQLPDTVKRKVSLSFARLDQIAPGFTDYWLSK